MNIRVGDVLVSRYRAARLLGRGGMGEVWACFDLEEKRFVAVKLVLAKHVFSPWVRRLFHAEVVAVARLSHRGIVDVYDLVTGPDGGALLVMALRAGKPLDHWTLRNRTWPLIRDVIEQLLEALAHAHARSVLHLDLKPGNVLMEPGPPLRTTLVDFGVARIKQPGHGAERWHHDGAVFGTLEYMAPEQWRGELEKLGPWTDLYSVGVIAHELCTGLLPFESGTDTALSSKRRLTEPAPEMAPQVHGVPKAFVDLVGALLALSPTARPVCAADVLGELRAMPSIQPPPAVVTVPPPPDSHRAHRAEAETTLGPGPSAPDVSAPPISHARPPAPTEPSSSRGTSRRLTGPQVEQVFSAEEAPPTPGAYGLFGLRELPVLGRVDERRAVYRAVQATAEEGRPSAVILCGPAGTGKSRLARDAVERALELGLATSLHTHWSMDGSPDEGLRGLVENALESRGSQGADFEARLAFFAARFPLQGDDFVREARVLLRPSHDAAPDADLPVRVAADLVLRVAAHRAVILRLDDVHASRGEAAALARAVSAASPRAAVAIVATERDDVGASDAAAAFAELAGHVERIEMQPLNAAATAALVRGLLALDGDIVDLIARRSEGNPLFASQLVAQLVQERAVERRGREYVLSADVDIDRIVPPDIGNVWSRAVALCGADAEDLVALAMTRERVSSEVVDQLAQVLGDRFQSSLTKALAVGLVRQDAGLFQFSHGMLRDYLLSLFGEERAAPLHEAAAAALCVLSGREDVDEARARHLRAAGRANEALDTMLSAAMWSWRRAERAVRMRRLIDLVDWAGATAGPLTVRARALAELAHAHADGGNVGEANANIERAKSELTAAAALSDRVRHAAWIVFREAQVHRLQGRLESGRAASEAGILLARRAGELEVEALCVAQLGLDAYRRGDYVEAGSRYDVAIDLVSRAGNRATEAHILMLKSGLEPPERMEPLCRAAVQMAREAGAFRTELHARLTWTEALFRTGQHEQAFAETRELSCAAQRCSLRQIVSMAEGVAACWAVVTGARVAAARHLTVAQKWGASSGSVTERATAAAVELAMGLSNGDDVASEAAMAVLLREGRTYAEPHFKEVIRRLLETSPNHFKERLRILDAASPDA
jgi:serine/threonine protein kinase/tetratricopeptide (TPR) repeat protein